MEFFFLPRKVGARSTQKVVAELSVNATEHVHLVPRRRIARSVYASYRGSPLTTVFRVLWGNFWVQAAFWILAC